jgi:hypothetical protein
MDPEELVAAVVSTAAGHAEELAEAATAEVEPAE